MADKAGMEHANEAAQKRRAPQSTGQELTGLEQVDPAALRQTVQNPGRAIPDDILNLQRTYGNRTTSSLLANVPANTPSAPVVQAKLTVGPVGDKYEQEADHIAEKVMKSPSPSANTATAPQASVQREVTEEEEIQAKPLAASITPVVQRQPEEEELLQAKPLAASITPVVQRMLPDQEEELPVDGQPAVDAEAAAADNDAPANGADPAAQAAAARAVADAAAEPQPEPEAPVDAEAEAAAAAAANNALPVDGQPARGNGVRDDDEMAQRKSAGQEDERPAIPDLGPDMSQVSVHRNSQNPAQIGAQAYTQGNDIHLGPGQEQHLPHEAWHVVQQQQGRVRPPMQQGGVRQEDEAAQRKAATSDGGFQADSNVEQSLAAQKGQGNSLPDDVKTDMEARFGTDFSRVSIHTGGNAGHLNKQLKAQAFTHGRDIYFAPGKYNPGSGAGKRLLAHELTHVVQQTGGQKPARSGVVPAKSGTVSANVQRQQIVQRDDEDDERFSMSPQMRLKKLLEEKAEKDAQAKIPKAPANSPPAPTSKPKPKTSGDSRSLEEQIKEKVKEREEWVDPLTGKNDPAKPTLTPELKDQIKQEGALSPMSDFQKALIAQKRKLKHVEAPKEQPIAQHPLLQAPEAPPLPTQPTKWDKFKQKMTPAQGTKRAAKKVGLETASVSQSLPVIGNMFGAGYSAHQAQGGAGKKAGAFVGTLMGRRTGKMGTIRHGTKVDNTSFNKSQSELDARPAKTGSGFLSTTAPESGTPSSDESMAQIVELLKGRGGAKDTDTDTDKDTGTDTTGETPKKEDLEQKLSSLKQQMASLEQQINSLSSSN